MFRPIFSDETLRIQIGCLAPFCMQNPILSWRTNRNNATFIIAPEIYGTLMLVRDNSGFPQCPWTGPYSTTHIATQINIKFSSQNLFAAGIIQMAHKRLVMQRQQKQSTTKRPYLLYTLIRIIRTWCVRRTVTGVRTGTATRTWWHIGPALPYKMRNVGKKQFEQTRAGNSIPTTCI